MSNKAGHKAERYALQLWIRNVGTNHQHVVIHGSTSTDRRRPSLVTKTPNCPPHAAPPPSLPPPHCLEFRSLFSSWAIFQNQFQVFRKFHLFKKLKFRQFILLADDTSTGETCWLGWFSLLRLIRGIQDNSLPTCTYVWPIPNDLIVCRLH